MLISCKGIAVYFCLFVLFAVTAVHAQDSPTVDAPGETGRPFDNQRARYLTETPKPLPDALAHNTSQYSADWTERKHLVAAAESETESKIPLSISNEAAATKPADEGLKRYAPMWGEEELRKNANKAARFPSPVEREFDREENDDPDDPASAPPLDRFHWKPAFEQSLIAQGFQHGYALVFQEKTQRALKGPFFKDYWESVKGVRGWDDGNRFFTNYIAHPMQGSMTGFIYLQNHDRLKRQMFNESAQYWKDRVRALVWSTAWSTNWEIGPISQASIGNVGYYGHGGYVDLVVTPTVGTAWMITEEALDRYIIRHAEGNLAVRILLRTVLNPTRSVANVLRFKKPWYRDRAQ